MGLGVITLVAIGITVLVSPLVSPKPSRSPTTSSPLRISNPAQTVNGAHATMAEFNSLWEGMSYEDACRVIGSAGSLVSSTAVDGIPGYTERIEMKMYSWYGDNGIANMNATFQNNRLVNRTQIGLR